MLLLTSKPIPIMAMAVGKLFVVPAWALDIGLNPILYRASPNLFLGLRQYRSNPAAQLLPISSPRHVFTRRGG